MKLLTGLIVSIWFCVFTSSASASWQFTKWGMSPAQVLKASQGRAHRMSDTDIAANSTIDQETDLEMDYPVGDRHYRALFRFTNNKLTEVSLLGEDDTDNLLLLKSKYGKPDEESQNSAVWYRGGDQIVFILGQINYMPRVTASNSGL